MQNAHIINFLKAFSFNPSCKEILDDFDKLNNNQEEFDKFVNNQDDNNGFYQVVLFKDDLSCLIQQIKEEITINGNVYKLLVDGKSEDNSICLIVCFKMVVKNGKPYVEYKDSVFYNKENKIDSLLILDTLVYFSSFVVFLQTWFIQYANLQEELYKEMPDFVWFFKVFLSTQYENFFECYVLVND